MSSEIATTESKVPDLVRSTPLEIDADDIVLPRVKIGHPSSDYVQKRDNDIGGGDVFYFTGQDDPDPVKLWEFGSEDPGPIFYVLGMRKGKSDDSSGELERYAFDDPEAPVTAWVTYNYVIAIPDEDKEVPFKLLLTKSGKPAATQINTWLRKHKGAPFEVAFQITSEERKNTEKKHTWYVPIIRKVDATPEGLEVAESLAGMIAALPEDPVAPAGDADEPAI